MKMYLVFHIAIKTPDSSSHITRSSVCALTWSVQENFAFRVVQVPLVTDFKWSTLSKWNFFTGNIIEVAGSKHLVSQSARLLQNISVKSTAKKLTIGRQIWWLLVQFDRGLRWFWNQKIPEGLWKVKIYRLTSDSYLHSTSGLVDRNTVLKLRWKCVFGICWRLKKNPLQVHVSLWVKRKM